MASAPASAGPAPFICGVARSGTTLLRLMLDAHPELAIPPETHFLPDLIARLEALEDPTPADALAPIRDQREWEDFGFTESELLNRFAALEPLSATAVARAFFEAYAERHGKRRWGDKTPMYVKRMATIERVLPEARFVHLIRDGRDIALSRDERRAGRGLEGPPVDRSRGAGSEGSATPAARPRRSLITSRSATRTWCSTPSRTCAASAISSSSTSIRRCCATTSRRRASRGARPRPSDRRRRGARRRAADAHAQARLAGAAGRAGSRAGSARWRLAIATRSRRSLASCSTSSAMRSAVDSPPAPFIVGVARSGTTLLRLMLDAHPELAIPPETHFVPALIEAAKDGVSAEQAVATITSHRTWQDFGFTEEELRRALPRRRRARRRGDAVRAFFDAYAAPAGEAPLGRQDPAYVRQMHADRPHPARGALRPPDPRRPRRRPLAAAPRREAAAARRGRRALERS